jgi:hypothetical protein
MQNTLSKKQVLAFYHDLFVQQQVEHFKKIAFPNVERGRVVIDIGGGCGFFASTIKKELNILTRVIDMDPSSVQAARVLGVEALIGDALRPDKKGDETVACFNLILHHLVADSDDETLALQAHAISTWRECNTNIFVNEYIYESWLGTFSGWIIYQITKNRFLSTFGMVVSKVLPSLRANTFGVGVRFRSNDEWKYIFEKCGFAIAAEQKGEKEFVSLPRRLLLIKEIRRNSFFLVAK